MLVPPGFRLPAWAAGPLVPRVYAPFRPLPPAAVAAGLDLLEFGGDDWFVDFGCGDGGVLQAALARTSRVTGVEIDGVLAAAAAARCPAADVLHEPLGWTPPVGPTCGLFYQLPWALPPFLGEWSPYFVPGFRLLVPLPPDPASLHAATAQLRAAPTAAAVVSSDVGPIRLLVHTYF